MGSDQIRSQRMRPARNTVHPATLIFRLFGSGRVHARRGLRKVSTYTRQILAWDTSPAKALFFREQRDGEGVATFRGLGAKIRKKSVHWVCYTLGVTIGLCISQVRVRVRVPASASGPMIGNPRPQIARASGPSFFVAVSGWVSH